MRLAVLDQQLYNMIPYSVDYPTTVLTSADNKASRIWITLPTKYSRHQWGPVHAILSPEEHIGDSSQQRCCMV